MGSSYSTTHLQGSSNHLPNSGISPVYLPPDVSPTTRQVILQALEHRAYHRYVEAEALLMKLVEDAQTERDFFHAIIHYSVLQIHIGRNIQDLQLIKLAMRIDAVQNLVPGLKDSLLEREHKLMKDFLSPEWVRQGISKLPHGRFDVSKMSLESMTESEKDLILHFCLLKPYSDIGNDQNEFLRKINQGRQQLPTDRPLLEHEVYLYYVRHNRNYDVNEFRFNSIIELWGRLIPEGRFDLALDFHALIERHCGYRKRIKPLILTMMGSSRITKRQHTLCRIILAYNSFYTRDTHIKHVEAQRLMAECNDQAYKIMSLIGKGRSKVHNASISQEAAIWPGMKEGREIVDSLIKFKCYREANEVAKVGVRIGMSDYLKAIDGKDDANQYARGSCLAYLDTFLVVLRKINLETRDPPEDHIPFWEVCLEQADCNATLFGHICDAILVYTRDYPWWASDSQLVLSQIIYKKADQQFYGQPIAIDAAKNVLNEYSLLYPKSIKESDAAFQVLLQYYCEARKPTTEGETSHSSFIAQIRRKAIAFAHPWIESDLSHGFHEKAFEKAIRLCYLALQDPAFLTTAHQGSSPETLLCRRIQDASPVELRAMQEEEISQYLQEYGSSL